MPDITVYTSDACPYCLCAKRLLDQKGAVYEEIHIRLNDFEARQRIAELTGRMTVPQIIVGGRPIGGWDDLAALDRAGELDGLLTG